MYQTLLNKLTEANTVFFQLDNPIKCIAGVTFPLERLRGDKSFFLLSNDVVPVNLVNEAFTQELRDNPIINEFLPDLLESGQFFYTIIRTMDGDTVDSFGIVKEIVHHGNSSMPKVSIYVTVETEWAKAYIPKQPRLWFEVPTPDKLVDLPFFNFRKSLELANLIRAKYYNELAADQLKDIVYEPLTWCGETNRPIYIVKVGNRDVGFVNTTHLDNLGIAYLLE